MTADLLLKRQKPVSLIYTQLVKNFQTIEFDWNVRCHDLLCSRHIIVNHRIMQIKSLWRTSLCCQILSYICWIKYFNVRLNKIEGKSIVSIYYEYLPTTIKKKFDFVTQVMHPSTKDKKLWLIHRLSRWSFLKHYLNQFNCCQVVILKCITLHIKYRHSNFSAIQKICCFPWGKKMCQ